VEAAVTQFPTPTVWYDRLVVRALGEEECQGVPIAVGTFRNEEALRVRLADALRLLAVYAPQDLIRMRQLMRGIVVTRLHGSYAEWRHSIRVCVVSTHYLQRAETTAELVAATLIHELAHARMDFFGVKYTEDRWARIERICFQISRRFLERLPESNSRKAALDELREYLSFDTDVWQAVIRRDYRPWYLRALSYALQGGTYLWHRGAPT
jgi:hypothetical protein